MTLKQFKAFLDVYGSDLGRWPEQHRAAALALLDQSEAAKTAFVQADAFDDILRSGETELGPSDREALIGDIMASIGQDDSVATPRAAADAKSSDRPAAAPIDWLISAGLSDHRDGGRPPWQDLVGGVLAELLADDRLAVAQAVFDPPADDGHPPAPMPDTLPPDRCAPSGGAIEAAFIAGQLTDVLISAYAAIHGRHADRLLRGLAALSHQLDRQDRQRFLAILAIKLR